MQITTESLSQYREIAEDFHRPTLRPLRAFIAAISQRQNFFDDARKHRFIDSKQLFLENFRR